MPEFSVYILKNAENRFYIGHTQDLEKRISDHNQTNSISGKYTRKNGPWELVWSELHPTRSSAMKREKEIKSWKSAVMIRRRLIEAQLSGRVPS